ncbi:MAG TPA: hypothetical protein VF354_03285, partial [Candidatus Methanoperedens sp.]
IPALKERGFLYPLTHNSIKRAASLRRVLKDRYVPMDILVRTPEELKHRIDIGDPFIKKILREGQVIYARDSAIVGQ